MPTDTNTQDVQATAYAQVYVPAGKRSRPMLSDEGGTPHRRPACKVGPSSKDLSHGSDKDIVMAEASPIAHDRLPNVAVAASSASAGDVVV